MKRWMLLCFLLPLSRTAAGQEFRALLPIPTPPPHTAGPGAPAFVPVDPRLIETAVRELFTSWNTPRLRELLGPDFYDADRLVDTLAMEIPRDARLRILAIEAMTTLSQTKRPGGPARPDFLISTVSVLVRTQLEYNDPNRGFQRRDGLGEYIFEVRGVAQQ